MRFKNLIVFSCSLILLCACATKNSTVKPSAPNNANSNGSLADSITKIINAKHERSDEILSFIESYSNLAPDAQKKTFVSTNQALAENKLSIVLRTKMAIMLALPTSRMRDPAKAQNLLQDLLREDSLEPQESALLGLLYEYAQNDSKQLQKSRDDAKKVDSTQQKYEVLQQKHEALEQKLNELKNIEKTMGERNTKTDSKP